MAHVNYDKAILLLLFNSNSYGNESRTLYRLEENSGLVRFTRRDNPKLYSVLRKNEGAAALFGFND